MRMAGNWVVPWATGSLAAAEKAVALEEGTVASGERPQAALGGGWASATLAPVRPARATVAAAGAKVAASTVEAVMGGAALAAGSAAEAAMEMASWAAAAVTSD